MRAEGLATLDLGNGRTAHFQAAGKRYAEVVVDAQRRQAVVVFQGTRLAVQSDVAREADVLKLFAAADGMGRLAVLVNQQNFTKTSNCWGIRNNKHGTNTNRIVLLRRI